MLLFSLYYKTKLKFLKETDGILFLHATDVNWEPVYIGFFGLFWVFFQHLGLNARFLTAFN